MAGSRCTSSRPWSARRKRSVTNCSKSLFMSTMQDEPAVAPRWSTRVRLARNRRAEEPASVLGGHSGHPQRPMHGGLEEAVLGDVGGELVEAARHRQGDAGLLESRVEVDPAPERDQAVVFFPAGAQHTTGQRGLDGSGEERNDRREQVAPQSSATTWTARCSYGCCWVVIRSRMPADLGARFSWSLGQPARI